MQASNEQRECNRVARFVTIAAVPTIRVDVSPAPYDVIVEPGLLSKIGQTLRPMVHSNTAALIFDSNCVKPYRAKVLAALCDCFERVIENTTAAGEENKNLAAVERLYDQIIQHRIDRKTAV